MLPTHTGSDSVKVVPGSILADIMTTLNSVITLSVLYCMGFTSADNTRKDNHINSTARS